VRGVSHHVSSGREVPIRTTLRAGVSVRVKKAYLRIGIETWLCLCESPTLTSGCSIFSGIFRTDLDSGAGAAMTGAAMTGAAMPAQGFTGATETKVSKVEVRVRVSPTLIGVKP